MRVRENTFSRPFFSYVSTRYNATSDNRRIAFRASASTSRRSVVSGSTASQAAAVRDLKTYLDFAARGTVALGEAVRRAGTEDYANDFEQSIAEMLRAKGWSVRTQIGVSKFSIDLGIVHPDAPGRFTTTTGCPSRSASRAAIWRKAVSVLPPEEKPLTIVIGRVG